jgi:serine/threonine protein kinase
LDLKSANILIQKNYTAKITDFGESYHSDIPDCKNDFKPGRTYPYAPPEIIDNSAEKINKLKDNKKVDVFSLGVIMNEILFDEYPMYFRRLDN